MNFGKIGVLMGGPSPERDISIKSGMAVYGALKEQGHDVVMIELHDGSIIRFPKIDIAFIAMHGPFGEDGTIQSILEKMQIPYTGSGIEASRLGMDKVASRELFKKAGLNVPCYLTIYDNQELTQSLDLGYPLVVKPVGQGSSIGVSIVKAQERLKEAIELAFQYDKRIIIEEYIQGRELTVGIFDNKPLPVIEIVPKKGIFDFECKYQQGMTEYLIPALLSEKDLALVQKMALSAHKALGAKHFSRVDIIWKDNIEPVVLEINTIPGFTSTSLLPKAARYAGLEFGKLCERILELSLKEYREYSYAQATQ